MNLNQFKCKLTSKISIKGEYEGNENTGKVVIFSHGFGVQRDDRGMFNDLGDNLKNKFLIVRFDYSLINEKDNSTEVYPYSIQSKMLKKVYSYIKNKFSPNEVNIIAHSMGCLIVGLARIKNLNKVLLLSGPPSSPYSGIKKYFSNRSGTKIDENGTSILKRSDGSLTYIKKNFWKEMKSVNPPKLYSHLAKNSEVIFIRALSDQVITETEFSKISKNSKIKLIEIDGNHNFEGKARRELTNLISKYLTI